MPTPPNPLETTLRSVARLEAAGLRQPRLTEPDLARWNRFRRKLGWRAFIEILHEDLAGSFPVPFDIERRWLIDPFEGLTEEQAEAMAIEAARSGSAPIDAPVFLRECARALGLPDTASFSGLPRVQPHHRVLELPGAGGRIAAALCSAGSGLVFHQQFTFVADTTAEIVGVGLAAVELRANEPRILTTPELRAAVRGGESFDQVLGLRGSGAAVEIAGALFPEARLL
ncbi:MAG: hypothetical protein IT372_08510 [Polyangiaceae bacterium]|nr:hypothetical protein [Polyangiaceae bacterium]